MAPNYYQSHYNEGVYYQTVGDEANAAQSYENAIKLGCIDHDVYKYLLYVYQKQGRAGDADRMAKLLQ
jgi:tetratricopeptide (TPR) repeat protein